MHETVHLKPPTSQEGKHLRPAKMKHDDDGEDEEGDGQSEFHCFTCAELVL
jgi:hypothetical protein